MSDLYNDLTKYSFPKIYTLFKYLKIITEKTRNPGEVIKEIMVLPELKKHGSEISKLVPKLLKSSKINSYMENSEDEIKLYKKNKEFFKEVFKAEFEFVLSSESTHPKTKNALPEKPAILVE